MQKLTEQQQRAAVLLDKAVVDFQENYKIDSQCYLRFNFLELTDILYHPIMRDDYGTDTHFENYLKELYRISLVRLSVLRSKNFHNDFTSLKLVTHLYYIKSKKVESLFMYLKERFDKKQ